MDKQSLLRRAEDLFRRSAAQHIITHTGFLTPAEQHTLAGCPHLRPALLLHGGGADTERQVAFFLPEYLDPADFDPREQLSALQIRCRFGAPGHRDVLGSLLGLGIERWTLGDIYTEGETAWVFCLPTVVTHICRELTHIGRGGVQVAEIALTSVPAPERKREKIAFTVSSLRLDAVLAGTFGLSRSQAAEKIAAGLVQLNYEICEKVATELTPGDVFSLRGSGKAKLAGLGGHSKKGRLFIKVETYA